MTTTLLPSDRILTPRRIEILVLAANGHTNLQIAQKLFIGEESVKSHFQVIKRHLGARDRTHAIAIALVRGLIHPHQINLLPPKEPQ
ncbi:response regulator transcription factor [Streptomyces sp. NPDC059761]|uniref:response regulator transcription factor n=1 Tax=Streptomyces sp. NPDC059761 TaxID=3346937 RepID=UPI0036470698